MSALIIPQVIFAAWWNPFTWKIFFIFRKNPQVQVQPVSSIASGTNIVSTSTNSNSLESPKELETAKRNAEKAKAEAESERLRTEKAKAEAEAAKAKVEKQHLQNELDTLKQQQSKATQTEVETQKTTGVYCNGKYWGQCPSGQKFYCSPIVGNAYCVYSYQYDDLINNRVSLCNSKIYSNCLEGKKLICPPFGNAYCESNEPTTKQAVPQTNTQTASQTMPPSQNNISELMKYYTAKVTESETNYKKMETELAPYKEQIAILEAKEKEVGCDIIDMSRIIGSLAQQCNQILAEKGVIFGKEGVVIAKYGGYYRSGLTNPSFNIQQSILGHSYKFYYNGYGSGSIYSSDGSSWNIYCAYGACNIYGN